MRRLAALSIVMLALPAASFAQARGPSSDTTTRAVDRVFAAWQSTDGPGCALGVSRNGRAVYEHGYGMANLETGTPITPSSIFHVASVSKQFTAAAIMLLARDGKLSLDDDVRKYIPELPDYGARITIRHLLTHTSGLRDQWNLLALARGRFEEDRITEADVMDIVPRQKALNFTPGAEYLYSNTGYTLAAVIVKRVSGKSLREFADERIFRPLGMTSTHFHDDYTMLVPGRTSAYASRGSGWRVSIPNYDTYGATSLFTTVGDLLKWEANFDAPVVGDRALLDQMQTSGRLTAGDSTGYGLGLALGVYRGARLVEHGGADAGYRTIVGRFPEQALGYAVLCNAATANPTALARGVADVYLAGLLGPRDTTITLQGVTVAPAVLASRAGVYIQPTTLQLLELILRDGKLVAGRQSSAPALVPVSENRFRLAGQPVEIVFADATPPRFERRLLGGGPPLVFERREAIVAAAGLLAPYAGQYYSEELQSTYRVTASDSLIRLQTGTSTPIEARPMFADTFLGNNYTIQFVRKGREIVGFEVTDGRMRRVRFDRVRTAR